MRDLSPTLTNILYKDHVRAFSLIKIEFASGTVYLTDYYRDVTYEGDVYSSSGGLVEFEPPNLSSTVDREAYRISVADQDNIFQALFRSGAIGTPVTVVVVFVGDSGPELDPADVMTAYKGRINEAQIENNFTDKLAVITLSSPMASLDRVNSFWTTKYGMDQFSATDTSFDNVLDNAEEVVVKWGK